MTPEQRQERTDARTQIVQAANRHRLRYQARHGLPLAMLSMRHLSWAVFTCRQHRLVLPATLERAGFRA